MNTATHSRRKYIVALSLLTALAFFLLSCGESGGNDPNTSNTTVTASKIKRAATDIQDSYVVFSASSTVDLVGYRFGVAKTKPSAFDMSKYGLKRNISNTAINILIAQRLNTDMVDFAEQYFANTNHRTLGAGMSGSFSSDSEATTAVIYDDTATGENDWVAEAVLNPSTDYKVYGMTNGGTDADIVELFSFKTDATPSRGNTGIIGNQTSFFDSTLARRDGFKLNIAPNELYIFPIQTDIILPIEAFTITYSEDDNAAFVILSSMSKFGTWRDLFKNSIVMTRNLVGDNVEDGVVGAYMLFKSSSHSGNSHYYRKDYAYVQQSGRQTDGSKSFVDLVVQ